MKFGLQFELYKIPEWYDKYLDYEALKDLIEGFQEDETAGGVMKLPGYYIFTRSRQILPLSLKGFDGDKVRKSMGLAGKKKFGNLDIIEEEEVKGEESL